MITGTHRYFPALFFDLREIELLKIGDLSQGGATDRKSTGRGIKRRVDSEKPHEPMILISWATRALSLIKRANVAEHPLLSAAVAKLKSG